MTLNEYIKNLPTEEQEIIKLCTDAFKEGYEYGKNDRPHGEWISGNSKCPCCNKNKFHNLDADIWADWQPNYCPNCGADMRPKGEWDIYGGIL